MRKTTVSAAGVAGILLAAVAFCGTPASAQMGAGPGMMGQGWGSGQGGAGGWGPGMRGWGRGMMGGCGPMGFDESGETPPFVDGRIAFLKTELGITDAQAKPWAAFVEAMKSNFVNMQGLRQAMQSAFAAGTPVERLNARLSVMESRVAALKEMQKPLGDLYGALSDAQKKKADDLLTAMGCMM